MESIYLTPEFSITPDTADALVEKIKGYAAGHPNEKILFGRADFSMTPPSTPLHDLLDRGRLRPPADYPPHQRTCLVGQRKGSGAGGNQRQAVADPEEEKYIIRDASGHPSGVLLEAAMEIVERAVFAAVPREDKLAMLREASHFLNRYGVTSVVNATGSLAEIELYAALRDRGQLTVRTRNSFGAVAVNHHLTPAFLADLEKARTQISRRFWSQRIS